MHLPHDDCCALSWHVTRTNTVLHSVGSIWILLHFANASPRKRDNECTIAKPIELASEWESPIRNQSNRIDWLFESHSIIEMLCKAFSTIMINIDCHWVDEAFIENLVVYQGFLHVLDPFWGWSYIPSYTSANIGSWLCELASSPHISIAKEKFGSLYSWANDSGLHSHLQELI